MVRTLLVNWVYYRPVGHALEGLKVANGYFLGNDNLEVSVLLNSEMPFELVELCPWIKSVYTADVHELAERGSDADCLKAIPPVWDYIVSDDRLIHSESSYTSELLAANHVIVDYLKARIWKGCRQPAINDAPLYLKDAKMRFQLPQQGPGMIEKYNHPGLKVCILPAGSNSDHIYPQSGWWISLMETITSSFPDVKFFVTGARTNQGNRSQSYTLSDDDVNMISESRDNSVNCFDIGIINQVVLLSHCDLLISPHSGFSFLASCVNTPWLAISGARWPEYFYNHIRFYSVLPSCTKYPCYTGMKKSCSENISYGKPVECMEPVQLNDKIPDIIDGIKKLINPGFRYHDSVKLYKSKVVAGKYPLSNFWTFDMSFSIID
jgi:ADP-heptose:LPS heptosyltransferase